jgi:hypothetical protein
VNAVDSCWWELPGPRAFVRAVWEDLQAGKNVVLALPATTPPGLRDALAATVRQNELWAWRDFPVPEGRKSAADLAEGLHMRFAPPDRVGALLSPTTLAGDSRLTDTLIWVEGITLDCWTVWSDFLIQYQHACRSRLEPGCGLFCVPLIGSLARQIPQPDVALSVRRWRGVVGPIDLLLDLSLSPGGLAIPTLHRRLALAVACELAGSDAVLARELIRRDLRQLLEPLDFLRTVALSRNWSEACVRQPSWEEGLLDSVAGVEEVHSAVLALRGEEDAVRR